jgi:hypothetical protein
MGYKWGTQMKVHDFRKGPIWDEALKCFRCDLRLPDGKRLKKRFRERRQAERWWNRIQNSIYEGTWAKVAQPKSLTFGKATDLYRESARVRVLLFSGVSMSVISARTLVFFPVDYAYRIVVSRDLCPIQCCTVRGSKPARNMRVA